MAEFDKFGTSWSGAVIFHPLMVDTEDRRGPDGPCPIVLCSEAASANLTKYVWQWLYDKDKILTNKSVCRQAGNRQKVNVQILTVFQVY